MMRSTRGVLIGTAAVMLLVAAGAVVHADETQQSEQTIETDLPKQALPGEQITATTHWQAGEGEAPLINLVGRDGISAPAMIDINAETGMSDGIIGQPVSKLTVSVTEETDSLTYEFLFSIISWSVEPGETVSFTQHVGDAEVNKTIEIVEPSVDYYATDDGEITVESLEHALRNWRRGVIETSLLRDVVAEWRATS